MMMLCEYVLTASSNITLRVFSMTTDDPRYVWNDGVTPIPRSAGITALEPTSSIDTWRPDERYTHEFGRVRAV